MLIRAIPFALLLACASCGSKGGGSRAADDAAPADEPMPADAPELGIAAVDPFRWTLPDAALIELSVDAAAGSIDVTPTPGGLTLNAFPPGGTLHQLGFRRGDVIASIDGTALTDPSLLEAIYRRGRDAEALEVTVRRGGETLERTFYLTGGLGSDRADPGASDDPIAAELAAAVATGVRQIHADRLDLRYDVDALVVKALGDTPGLIESGFGPRGRERRLASAPTVLTALGLTPYDKIQSLDAHSIRSPISLAAALKELGTARSFSLSIIRVKTPLVIRYQIVDDLVMDAQLVAAVARWQQANPERDLRAGRPSAPRLPDDPATGITQLGDDHYAIERDVLATLISSSTRSARIVPAMRDGRSEGLKLYAVRPSSTLSKAGIRNGDAIHSIGGTPLESPDDLEAALAAAARGSTVTLEITRRGKPVTLTYDVR